MNLPKKLTKAEQSASFVNDERGKPAMFTSNDYDYNETFKQEVCTRYNNHSGLVWSNVIGWSLAALSLSALLYF